ncbi:hypothetical protein TI04_10975 [Achromatium sp. WMS2]|nr:hypothetical protein TI04_10975 [Achromatium sp. WMS2]
MNWFQNLIEGIRINPNTKRTVPEGLWAKCLDCNAILYKVDLERNLDVCPKCGYHAQMSARRRIEVFIDPESWVEIAAELESADPLKFKDSKKYKDRLIQAQKASNEKDALVVGRGRLHGLNVVVAIFEFKFMAGSMGSVVGEKFVRGAEIAIKEKSPLICFTASGGARMQESLFSLMQMAKTSAVLNRLRHESIPFISVLTNPTMGGVTASLAMLGDLNIAEPKALIGFAGQRVIEHTVREKLPEGFQRSEFLLEHGTIDMIVDRRELRDTIAELLGMLMHKNTV